ncbi:hypothetical protein RND81_14G138000 [Saponaria officinalis]|uniref:Uncharacterized protein n=1 Tax=Saponaria officinalis TaxID=3572 RepID=A0AAW1GMV9_SAPOF
MTHVRVWRLDEQNTRRVDRNRQTIPLRLMSKALTRVPEGVKGRRQVQTAAITRAKPSLDLRRYTSVPPPRLRHELPNHKNKYISKQDTKCKQSTNTLKSTSKQIPSRTPSRSATAESQSTRNAAANGRRSPKRGPPDRCSEPRTREAASG